MDHDMTWSMIISCTLKLHMLLIQGLAILIFLILVPKNYYIPLVQQDDHADDSNFTQQHDILTKDASTQFDHGNC